MRNKVTFPNNRPQLDLGDIEKPKNSLEHKTIVFTVVLYTFICVGLLGVHYAAPYLPKAPALLEEEEAEAEAAKSGTITEGGRDISISSSGSPHNPFLFTKKKSVKEGVDSPEEIRDYLMTKKKGDGKDGNAEGNEGAANDE